MTISPGGAEADLRIVIIGNSGSGKSTLARAIAAQTGLPATDLDPIHWRGEVGVKRDEDESRRMVAAIATRPAWIIEGVYGWLAEVALPRATDLIWLDLPWMLCKEGLAARGPWSNSPPEAYADFLAWAEAYWQRKTSASYQGHLAMFETFQGRKHRVATRGETTGLFDCAGRSESH